MTVLSMLACATSDTEASVVARTDGAGPVRIAYTTVEPADGAPMTDPMYSVNAVIDAQGVARATITGLTPRTRYWWRVEDAGVIADGDTAAFVTPPTPGLPASFAFAASGDAGLDPDAPGATGLELRPDLISNHEIHKRLAERMVAEGWLSHLYLGDQVYYSYGEAGHPAATVENYRRGYDDLQLQPNQVALFRAGSYIHIEDDHGAGPNNWDGTFTGKAAFAQVFVEREPHHDLPDAGGAMYRSFTWGRVLVVIWDCRYHRSPSADPDGPTKTMLGAAQLAWFEDLIQATTAEAIIIVSTVPWISGGPDGDSWPGYATERQAIADMVTAAGKAHRVVMISADAHRVALDTGSHNAWGGWPCAIFAARDASPSPPGALSGMYDLYEQGGRGQYGTVTVTDLGSLITVRLTGWQGDVELTTYTKAIATSTPTVVSDIADLASGSHRMLVEARILTEYQTGPDPAGETIAVLSGDVAYDATADVWSTMALETVGVNEHDLSSRFPRFPDSLLAPYGNEVFLRRGIDTGAGGPLWASMGYYRIDDTEQAGSSGASIRLTGADRWVGLAEARLIEPRQYRAHQTIAAVVYDLVLDVYPAAVVAWDDTDDQLPIGRDLIVEEDRAAALRDIATARSKICYWDSEGILRFEASPDPEVLAWDLRAGSSGVLVHSARRVSREGMYNAVVARGQGATESPAVGIAVDVGVHSPTRWGGRFGRVPRFYSSPLLTSNAEARAAAAAILARSIGMPYSVDFGTVPNPALRPRQAVRITQQDGTRETHIVETLTVPLTTGQMTGTTREQTLTQIASLLPNEAIAQPDPGD